MLQTYTVDEQLKSTHIKKYNKDAKGNIAYIVLIFPIFLVFPFCVSVLNILQNINNESLNFTEYLWSNIPRLIIILFIIVGCIVIYFKTKNKHICFIDENIKNESITIQETELIHTYTINGTHHTFIIPYAEILQIVKREKFNSIIIYYFEHKILEKKQETIAVQRKHIIPLYFINSEELETQIKEIAKKSNPPTPFHTLK